jgi:hypothetical protein
MNQSQYYSPSRVIPRRAENASLARTEGPREILRDNREVPRFARDDTAPLL